jgi:hypothetical protein
MRFSIDGSWIARNYLATRKAAAGNAFMALVQANKMGVPASYMSLMTGYATLEELIRSTDYTHCGFRGKVIVIPKLSRSGFRN